MKNIFIEAHKRTKEMVEKYEVDYQVQFGLFVSFLVKEEEKTMTNLKGTEKQVKYAQDIKEDMIETLNNLEQYVEESKQVKFNKRVNKTIKAIEEIEEAKEMINNFKSVIYIEEEIGKALKIAEIFSKQNKLGQAVFTNSIEQKHYDEYYAKTENFI